MPFAVTHVLLSIIVIDLYRDYYLKKKHLIPLSFIFYGGLAGLLPDIDIPFTWLVNVLGILSGNFHRLFTHSLFFPLIFLLISFFFIYKKNRKMAILLGIISFGTFFHIFLDFLFTNQVMLFYPLSNMDFGVNIFGKLGVFSIEAGLDAFILLSWLWHEEKKHKISDFI